MTPTDAGVVTSADSGLVVDAGSVADAGAFDAGAAALNSGMGADAGVDLGNSPVHGQGCGCRATSGSEAWWLLALAGVFARRAHFRRARRI